jgi:hypothetical protein
MKASPTARPEIRRRGYGKARKARRPDPGHDAHALRFGWRESRISSRPDDEHCEIGARPRRRAGQRTTEFVPRSDADVPIPVRLMLFAAQKREFGAAADDNHRKGEFSWSIRSERCGRGVT